MLFFPSGLSPSVEAQPNETVDRADDLGTISTGQSAGATGTIGNGPAGAADVSWYHFTLDSAATVALTAGANASGDTFQAVLSLYNEDLYDFGDSQNPIGRRLLAQNEASPGGLAEISLTLGAGSYDIAVSGAGNLYFHPLIAGSGYNGSTGDYNLLLTSRALNLDPNSGPAVLASNPAPGASLSRSPLALRLDLSGPLDSSTILAGSNVQLLYNPTGAFGDGNDVELPLMSVNFSATINELQLFPASALAPGFYRVVLSGDSSNGATVLANLDGTPLGAETDHPLGQNLSLSFQVTGIEGGTGPSDTLATAHNQGDVTQSGRVIVSGAIGNDPYYDASSFDPALNPGNQVDYYRFQVAGAGTYALVAEVFAGRIGSPLDPGVTLYRVDPDTQRLVFLSGNNNSGNQVAGTDDSSPLMLDPALFVSLTAGDYVLAVSTGFNTPSPLEGQPLDNPGLYNPEVSHSGQGSFGKGRYVLNFEVAAVPNPPKVVATTPAADAVLSTPPTEFSVQFSEPVNLQKAAYQAYLQNSQSALASVYVMTSDGTKYFPRLGSIDRNTNTATFQMLDALPNGSYELHLSGSNGLTDLGGNPLGGNDPSGDFVVHFQVEAAARGSEGHSLTWIAQEPAGGDSVAQDLGVLFPREFQARVTITRDSATDPIAALGDTEDSFRFEVLRDQFYTFSVQGSVAIDSATLWLTGEQGDPVSSNSQGNGLAIGAQLAPGVYVIHLGGWTEAQAADLSYQLHLAFLGNSDNPIPLVAGPSPALQMKLSAPPDLPTPTPPGVGGGSTGGGVGGVVGGGGANFPVSPTPAYGPPINVAGSGQARGGENGLGISFAGGTIIAGPSSGISAPGLIVLSVAPVGSLAGNAAISTSSSPVAFSLPSQTTSLSAVGQALVSLVTNIQVMGFDHAEVPNDPDAVLVDGPDVGPEAVFEEFPQGLAKAEEVPADKLEKEEVTKDGHEILVAVIQNQIPDIKLILKNDLSLAGGPRESKQEDAESRYELSDWLWGGVIATFGLAAIAAIKRDRKDRSNLSLVISSREGAMNDDTQTLTNGIARPMGGQRTQTQKGHRLAFRNAQSEKECVSA